MDLADKKRMATDYLQMIGDPARRSQALAMLADDATCWIPLRGGPPPWSKTELAEAMARADGIFKQAVQVTIKGITAEGDRVAIEAEGYVPVVNGKIYNNYYHILFEFRGDRIIAVREYLDQKHADEAFAGLASPMEAE
jgi:ketosteroid isomerase-like protein